MSCEKNENKASSAAATSGGIPEPATKSGNFIGRITGVSFVVNKIKEAQRRNAEKKAAAREVAHQKQLEAARRRVERIKDPQRHEAAARLQSLIGAQFDKRDFGSLFDLSKSEPLAEQMFCVSGDYGEAIYRVESNGGISIQAISPRLGREISLNSQLAAYVREGKSTNSSPGITAQASGSSPKPGSTVRKTVGWLKDNKTEIDHIANRYVMPLALGMARKDNYVWMGGRFVYIGSGPEPQDPFNEFLFGPQTERQGMVRKYHKMGTVATKMRQDVQNIRAQKLEEAEKSRRLVERLQDPDRKNAATQLQSSKVIGQKTSLQNLSGLMGNRTPKLISGNTYEIEGSLGHVYFDDLGNGNCSIEDVRPKLGRESQFRNGIVAILH